MTESKPTVLRAFIRSFVEDISVARGRTIIRYTKPMPLDSPIRAEKFREPSSASRFCHSNPDKHRRS